MKVETTRRPEVVHLKDLPVGLLAEVVSPDSRYLEQGDIVYLSPEGGDLPIVH